jgi:hypothetical protein
VLCYFQDVIERVVREHGGREVARLRSEIGDNPIFEIDYGGSRLAIVHPGVGAPLAAGFLEDHRGWRGLFPLAYPAPISSTIADGVSCSRSNRRKRAGCSAGGTISSQRRSNRSPSK